MYEKPLPFGEPVFFNGEYKDDRIYPLYIQMITCSFELKENKIPTIQIKNNRNFFRENEYLESSHGEIVCLVLTSVDLKLFLEQYKTENLEYISGWKFKSTEQLFKKYIDKWIKVKNEATISGNSGQRTMAKLMLNSLYGKLAKSLENTSKIPYLGDDFIVHYTLGDKEISDGIYIPARFIYYSIRKRKNNKNFSSYKRLFN